MLAEAVLVRAPLPAVRMLLRPESLPPLVPGLTARAGGGGTLRLWRPSGVSTYGVRLRRAADGEGALLLSGAGAPLGFRLSLTVAPAPGGAPERCLLEGRVRVEPDGGDPVAAAALRHALLRLVPEVAAAAEHAAAEQAAVRPVAADPAVTGLRTARVAAVLAAALVGGLVAAVVVRRCAGAGTESA